MKLTIIAAILLSATVATAASETTTTTTTTATATTEKAAPAKKAKKKAKKEEKKDGAQVAPATTAPAAAIAPAAATSTAAAPATAAPAKKWGVSLVNDTATDYAGGKSLSDATVENAGYIGASYKITATEKVGVRQYYIHSYDPTATKNFETSDINQSFTVATISSKMNSILGSDAFNPTLMYFLPGHTAEETNYGKDLDGFAGQLRGDAFVNWTVNPRWSFSYYLSARQTLGATEEYINANSGKTATFEASSRMINIGYVNYTINDNVSLYYNAGLDSRMATERMTSTSDDFVSSIGSTLGFLDGQLTFYTDVGVTTPLKSKGVAARSQELYKKENIAYTLTTIIAL